ncbi:hypothetical protein TSUD_232450 [Trifolium subterraneum]|uniref:F-box domain-containing protein n=1 Tax=Trifolium subterraneum TaxID=3900 RepID=A0A2Z6M5V1_TRISU|nr:hypothetical protein TSUD_232450 [Trifolium subterraneum]
MATPGNDRDDYNDISWSQPVAVETTTRTLILSSQIVSSSSNPPGDSLQMPLLPTLPFELIREILWRLPVKSLVKFKSVCKSWNFLISDPKFIKKHLCMSTMHPHLILNFMGLSNEFHMVYDLCSFLTTGGMQREIEYPLNRAHSLIRLVGSCKGMLCLIHEEFSVLWNPSIRKYKIFPSCENSRQEEGKSVYGFGYDHLTDNYKVVSMFMYQCYSTSIYKTEVKVHTLGTDSWRLIKEFPFGSSNAHSLGSGKFSLIKSFYSPITVERESWTKLVSIPMGVLGGSYISNIGAYINNVLYISEDDQVLMEIVRKFRLELVVYDSRNDTLKIPDMKRLMGMYPELYVESLISPCS